MLDSPARAYAMYFICLATCVYSFRAVWRAGHDLTRNPIPALVLIGLSSLVITILPIALYSEDVPNTSMIVTATVTDMDYDPTHETTEDRTDFTPTMMPMGDSFIMSGFSESYTVPVHVPAQYSILLHWGDQQAWVQVNGLTYRKLKIGSTVTLTIREQQDVTLFMKLPPKRVAGPIVAIDETQNKP